MGTVAQIPSLRGGGPRDDPAVSSVAVNIDLALGLLWYLVLLFSLTFHEAAHAWAAKKGGDETA